MADDIEYYFLKETDFDEVVAFLNSDFFQREPLTLGTHAKGKVDAGKGRMGDDVMRALKSGISLAAKDRNTGKMVGARISLILDLDNPQPPTQPPNELAELYRVLEDVFGKLEGNGKIIEMLLLSAAEGYGGRGIARKLVEMCMEAGYAKGASRACTCITNNLSGKLFAKLGYETRYTLDFEQPHDFKMDLSVMNGNTTVRLMTKTLP